MELRWAKLLTLVLAGLLLAAPAGAQDYPNKNIRLIVPYPAGASGDLIARLIGQRLSDNLKQPVVIDNRTGGSGVPATLAVAKAAPAGYTLLLTGMNHVANVGLYPSLPYDPAKDFAEISLVGSVPLALLVHPSAGFKSAGELIEKAKAQPKQFNFASAGIGTGGHLAMELFMRLGGVSLVHVPYRGATPALTDVVAGHVQSIFTGVPPALEFIKQGKLVPLVVSSPKRLATLPDTPTGAEIGMKEFNVDVWFGLFAPAGTPKPIVDLIARQVAGIVREPAFAAQMETQGIVPVGSSTEEFAAVLRQDFARWPQLIRDAGIKAE
ncbi:MAG TPA: tripartite tricarboxylate transporter substrate binding protein [Xanthobacteraceae bacterium]